MAIGRGNLVIGIAVVAGAAAVAFYFLTTGEKPLVQLEASDNVVRIEAAGVNYVGWPDMSVRVNGQEVAVVAVETQQRKMFEIDVPNTVGDIETVEVVFANDTDCSKQENTFVGSCTDRSLIIRKVFLNDQQLENPEVTGDRNTPYSLQNSDGGVTWQVTR